MALFLRGDIWWFEYRTRSVRHVKSTGFRKKDRAKAEAAWQAFRLGMGAKPKRSAMEAMLEAIYGDGRDGDGAFPLSSLWAVYEDWFRGKGRTVARSTWTNRRNEAARFVEWAALRGVADVSDATVGVAREYVRHLSDGGRANKTVRNIALGLSATWEAVGQVRPGLHNPWRAACPDSDGTSCRRSDFTEEQISAVLGAAETAGHDWRLASAIALYTGQRYGDVATLVWGDSEAALRSPSLESGVVDFDRRAIVLDPGKTRRSSGVRVILPIAPKLAAELAPRDRPPGAFVLPEHGVRYATRSRVSPPFSAVLEAAGVTDGQYTFHSFRHTANSRMAEAGIPSATRQMICGWTNAGMARHYDHARHMAEMAAAVAKI